MSGKFLFQRICQTELCMPSSSLIDSMGPGSAQGTNPSFSGALLFVSWPLTETHPGNGCAVSEDKVDLKDLW